MIATTLEIVGTKDSVVVRDTEKFLLLVDRILAAAAKTTYREIDRRLAQETFKHTTGRIHRALRWEASEGWSAVFMDEKIAPHAPYIEEGVESHTMRYLLKATRPIPIPVGNTTVFRRATEKWMGRPHPMVDPVSGLVFMTKGWIHSGFEGRHFFREGTKTAIEEVSTKLGRFIFKVSMDTGNVDIPEEL